MRMSEKLKKTKKETIEGLRVDEIVIPDGYEFALVAVDGKDSVDSICPQCGGSSLHTSPACVYCNTARTHYEYKKIGSENEADVISDNQSTMMDEYIVERGRMEGRIWAKEVTIGAESKVGDVVGGDNVYLEGRAQAGYVFAPIIRTSRDVTISQLATSVLTSSGSLHAGIVTIYDGGEAIIPPGSKVSELRLGRGVKKPNWITRALGIKKIVDGDFPAPSEWKK